MRPLFNLYKIFFYLYTKKRCDNFIKQLQNPQKAQENLRKKWIKHQTFSEITLSYEYTSGSSGAKKKIAYTKSLKHAFSETFLLWAHDLLFNQKINYTGGKIYISISPKIKNLNDGNDDTSYLNPITRFLINKFLAIESDLKPFNTGQEFIKYLTFKLSRTSDLEIISIWSPHYFLEIIKDLGDANDLQKIWPKLRLISTWSSGDSKNGFEKLKKLFPNTYIQPKGLLATEGPMTIPWGNCNGSIPLIHLVYFEFQDLDGNVLKIHELKENCVYEIFPQFPNNDAPINLGDLVRCTGFIEKTPLLEFIGRKGDSLDLVGEKLSAHLLRNIFQEKYGEFIAFPNPDKREKLQFQYIFITEKDPKDLTNDLNLIHHYKTARELNQLEKEIIIHAHDLSTKLLELKNEIGINYGDQKQTVFIKNEKLIKSIYNWAITI